MSPKYRFITFRHDRLSTLILETDWSEQEFYRIAQEGQGRAEFAQKIVSVMNSEWLRKEILKSSLRTSRRCESGSSGKRQEAQFGTQQHQVIKQLPKPEGLMLMARHLLLTDKLLRPRPDPEGVPGPPPGDAGCLQRLCQKRRIDPSESHHCPQEKT